ncbi:MAG TPA: 4Fe-4S binding protein [Firmicutes bacterium]|nr:4Fe-4S binding protein [Bacillota bacterium]
MFACARRLGKGGLAGTCIGVRSIGGMERGFKVVVCRACDDPPCARVCPVGALQVRRGGGVRLDEARCIGCGHCRDACVIGAVFWDDETGKPMICVHCGYCAKFCPHGVLTIERADTTESAAARVGMATGTRGERAEGQESLERALEASNVAHATEKSAEGAGANA